MKKRVEIPWRPPLDWDGIVAWLAARAIPGVESVEGNIYCRDGVTISRSGERLRLEAAEPTPELEARARRLFDVDADPERVREVLSRDELLAPLVAKRPGVRVPGAWDPFELAVRAIVGQQVSVAGARTILGRIAAKHGLSAEALAEAAIEGMPRRRAETIRILARAVADGEIVLERDDLTRLPGIGPWTASYIAMRLGDRDAFPAGDLVLRRNAGNLSERELLKRAEAWRPYRASAAMLLWMR
jgi:AraC family transcriptional regulator of adaptative response / DNA-3-methyladenine glycosylase II